MAAGLWAAGTRSGLASRPAMTHFGAHPLSVSSSGLSHFSHGPGEGLVCPHPPPSQRRWGQWQPCLSDSARGEARAPSLQLCQGDLPERF